MSETTVESLALDAYERYALYSDYLNREVLFDVYRTDNSYEGLPMNLLLVNDGQDLLTMPFHQLLQQTAADHSIQPLMVIGIHCGNERKQEYGIAYSADYMARGAKAGLYTKFILDELLPFIRKRFQIPNSVKSAFLVPLCGGVEKVTKKDMTRKKTGSCTYRYGRAFAIPGCNFLFNAGRWTKQPIAIKMGLLIL
jgi:hypothetical protein